LSDGLMLQKTKSTLFFVPAVFTGLASKKICLEKFLTYILQPPPSNCWTLKHSVIRVTLVMNIVVIVLVA